MPLDRDQIADAIAKAKWDHTQPHRQEAGRRRRVLDENFAINVAREILKTHNDESAITKMSAFVDVSKNIALDIVSKICVVWNRPPTRKIVRPAEKKEQGLPPLQPVPPLQLVPPPEEEKPAEEGAPPPFGEEQEPSGLEALDIEDGGEDEEATEALKKLYREAMVAPKLQSLNRYGWFLNDAVAIPNVTADGKMRVSVLTADMFHEIEDPDDPEGPPLGYSYLVGSGPDAHVVVLDDKAWKVWIKSRDPDRPDKITPHGLGYVPAVRLSFSSDVDKKSKVSRHRRLYDATINASIVGTQMKWVRHAQNKKLPLAVGLVGLDDAAPPHPSTGRSVRAEPGDVEVTVLDFDTAPKNFTEQLAFEYTVQAIAYGGEVTGVVAGVPQIKFDYETQSEYRSEQLEFARPFELEFAKVMIDLAKDAKHELALDLPDSEELEDTLHIEFHPLTRKFADVGQQQSYLELRKSNGAASPYTLLRELDPDLTDEQARALAKKNLEDTAEVNSFAAKRNMPFDVNGVQSNDEATGREGGFAKQEPDKGSGNGDGSTGKRRFGR